MAPFLSVVVVNWNSVEDLRLCLSSLRAQTYRELQVIVVDNGSTDGSSQAVAADFPECVLLAETGNLGFAEACNRGIAASTSEWVAMLNNDAIADPEWAQALVGAAKAVPAECGMLQSLLLYQSKPDVINSAGIDLTYFGGGADRKGGQARASATAEEEIFCPTAGAAAYRRAMLERIRLSSGYFDRRHFMYYEDTDLGWRARLAGFSARYIPTSIAYHRWHGSTERRGRSWLEAIGSTNRIRTLLKNASSRFIFTTIRWTSREAFNIVRHAGLSGGKSLVSAIFQSLFTRREVTAMLTVHRRDIELRWRT